MREKCECGRGKCERGRGSANVDGAGAEGFAGDGCVQGASFSPMAAISRRRQGGRIYNNTRVRELLRRMCVKPAALTTHSPLKISARPRTAHALPEHFFTPSSRRRTPADLIIHSPPKTFARPRSPDARPQAARCIPRRPHSPFPAEDLPSPPHSDTPSPQHFLTPFPRTSAPPPRDDARPPTAQPIPRRRPSLAPAQRHARPEHFRSPTQRRRTPAGCEMHSPPTSQPIPRSATLLLLPFRFGHKKNGTAQCMCDAECLGRPSLRSVIWVGEPRAVRRRCGALACRRGA